jgi:thiol-disulfide isomerase/thioredoxin
MLLPQRLIGFLLLSLALAACAAPASGTGSSSRATPDVSAGGPTTAMPAAPAMTAAATTAPALPVTFASSLTDVKTGRVFKLADFSHRVVLVEDMAVWCTTCFQQQTQVLALHKALAGRDDFVDVTLDVDAHENAATLKAYAAKNAFAGLYAVAPPEVTRELAAHLGEQYLNPPSAPMFVVDRQGGVHALPFGVKSADAMQKALQPYMDGKS